MIKPAMIMFAVLANLSANHVRCLSFINNWAYPKLAAMSQRNSIVLDYSIKIPRSRILWLFSLDLSNRKGSPRSGILCSLLYALCTLHFALWSLLYALCALRSALCPMCWSRQIPPLWLSYNWLFCLAPVRVQGYLLKIINKSRIKEAGLFIASVKVKANVGRDFTDNISGISNLTGLAVDIVESVTCLDQWDQKKIPRYQYVNGLYDM